MEELHYFPLDRQLCRIKITAEKPIEELSWKLFFSLRVTTFFFWGGGEILRYFEHFWPYLLLTWPSKRISFLLGLIQHGEHTGCAFVVAVLFPKKNKEAHG